ncbi:MAG: peptide ABC transporter permease [Bacteroidia bacterium]|nr:MAG: peptide ABC transporter permease [Bacteroidia bacterium]
MRRVAWVAGWVGWLVLVGVGYGLPLQGPAPLCPAGKSEAWLGTDPLGRRIEVRLLRGWGLSVAVGLASAGTALCLGVLIGLWSGTRPGMVDALLTMLLQAIWVVPALLWAAVLAFLFGRGFLALVGAIGLSTWTETARLVRIEVRRLWREPFMEAAKALGLSHARLLWRHLLPNLGPLLRVQFLQVFATAVIIEAGLGFVGLGLPPPQVSLGSLLLEAMGWLTIPQGQWQGILAGLCLSGTVFAVYSLLTDERHAL